MKDGGGVAKTDATRTSPALNYRSIEDSARIEREKELARRKTSVGPQSKPSVAMKQAAEERYAQQKRNEKYKKAAEYAQVIGGGLEVAAPFTGPLAPIIGGAGTLASAGSSAYLAGRDVAEENYGSALMNAGFGGLGIAGYTPVARAANVGGVNVAKAADAADYVSDVAGTYNAYDEYGRSYANKVKNIKETNWGKDYWEKLYTKDNELSALKLSPEDRFSQVREYEKSLLKDLGIGKNLGGGSYGQVYEYANDPSTVIKLGRPMSYGSLDSKNWTPEFIESANSINKYGNIAVPKNVKYFESPSTWSGTHEVMEMPNLNQSIGERLDLNKRDRYALFLKQARQLRDRGIKLDVANPLNFSYNKEKNIFDIYDVNPGFIHRPGHYMQHVINKTKGPLLENMPYKNGGWLDKYNDGGPIQPNYNDSSVSTPEGFLGDGYSNVGRNYSPAWGGQFAMGGSMPGATGSMYARVGAPSKGPHRNQTDVTDASAQNGAEMKYYQNGLDWKPKTISKNGSQLTKLDQSLNFTNYNKPTKGGWLDKYK
jgi:hypothetical protein